MAVWLLEIAVLLCALMASFKISAKMLPVSWLAQETPRLRQI
jgi:hypothetical protein